jgi:2-C-methyl-D-erythritol 2,4-cyclodiphosphate synthase
MKIRVGFGYDVHRLADNRDLRLGGIKIEHSRGLWGHSDADVLIHAVCDALLGAANLRDIGFHFPDNDGEYKDIDSKILLRRTLEAISEKGYKVGNIDATICAERPKINPHIPAMQKVMAEILQCSVDDISIKATTSEKMGFVGREEGFAAYAVALIEKEQ